MFVYSVLLTNFTCLLACLLNGDDAWPATSILLFTVAKIVRRQTKLDENNLHACAAIYHGTQSFPRRITRIFSQRCLEFAGRRNVMNP